MDKREGILKGSICWVLAIGEKNRKNRKTTIDNYKASPEKLFQVFIFIYLKNKPINYGCLIRSNAG